MRGKCPADSPSSVTCGDSFPQGGKPLRAPLSACRLVRAASLAGLGRGAAAAAGNGFNICLYIVKIGIRACPSAVRRYSTRGGTSA